MILEGRPLLRWAERRRGSRGQEAEAAPLDEGEHRRFQQLSSFPEQTSALFQPRVSSPDSPE